MKLAKKTNAVKADAMELKQLIKYAQIIPASMMQAIERIAAAKGISIELEIVSRLWITVAEPEILGHAPLSQKILNQSFNLQDATRECRLNHERWIYPYELKKLELFLEFQSKLPRKFKESFLLIDVNKETKRILEAMRKKKKNQDKG